MEPHLFDEAVDAQLARLSADAEAQAEAQQPPPGGATDLTLYGRIEDVKRGQRAQAVQARPSRARSAGCTRLLETTDADANDCLHERRT